MLKQFFKPTRAKLILLSASCVAFVMVMLAGGGNAVDETDPVGLVDGSIVDTTRNRELNYYVWYPTDAIGLVESHGANAVFHGFSAIQDAPLADGNYPLIVLSHGSGGNRSNQGWLATNLAKQGAIVIAANHPGSTSQDSAAATNITAWHRPEDISFILDHILADPQFAPAIDANRIAMVGHSLGGYTTLAIGGAELSLDQFISYCNDYPEAADCSFYREGGVDLTRVDRDRFEQPHRDERVSSIVVIDPAYARSIKAASIPAMADTLLIAPPVSEGGLGDLQISYLVEQMGEGAHYVEMDGAHHFTYLPECKPVGSILLRLFEEDGELLCWPEEGGTRTDFHDKTTNEIVAFLQTQSILK